MFNYLRYLFFWVILRAIRYIKNLFIFFIPRSFVKNKIIQLFGEWGVKVTTDSKEIGTYDRKKYHCEMVVHNEDFFTRLLQSPVLNLGESYMDGWWDCSDIALMTCCLIKNAVNFSFLQKLYEKKCLARNQQKTSDNKKNNEHYNIGNDLYEAFLDKNMNYSCGYWKPGTKTLEEAQVNKLDLVARKLKLKKGMKVLDIGCGWGSAAKYLAEKYEVSVTAYNISLEQVQWAQKRCEGLENVEIILEDYRKATGIYDRVYSIGFFEHVGSHNYRGYFEVCKRCLKDDGIMLIHSIGMKDGTTAGVESWTGKYIFPGGELPKPGHFFSSCEGLFMVEDFQNMGFSYKKTLEQWNKNFQKNWPELKPNYEEKVNGKFKRMWEYYLLCAMGGFQARTFNLYQVVYSKKGVEGGYDSVR